MPDGATLETDVCIVGAGPAGLILAAQLLGHGVNVAVLESGAGQPDPGVLALNQGSVVGDPYAGLAATRHRRLGGTTAIWNTPVQGEVGAKYVPLDRVDFEERAGRERSGWPVGFSELAPYYVRALSLSGLDTSLDEVVSAGFGGTRDFPLLADPIVPGIYRFGTRRALIEAALGAIRQDGQGRICTHATVLRLHADAEGSRVAEAAVGTPGGSSWRMRARRFVLAGGAIENARLLLVSGTGNGGLGNESGWVGRCFMEHPRDTSLRFVPHNSDFYAIAGAFDVHEGRGGFPVLGRIGLSRSALASGELLNAGGTLFPEIRLPFRSARARLGRLASSRAGRTIIPSAGHGWSEYPHPRLAFHGMRVLLNLEQSPHPENRVRLATTTDALGVPRAELHWRWMPEDQGRLDRLRLTIAEALEASGFGRVTIDTSTPVDPNAHHHAGTTRMHEDPAGGVVDARCRVHSLENVYVAGSSVFPTAGFANPVLTVIALAIRLADQLTGG
jgi:choline dehydrogenase-like flavoprotein